MTIDKNKSKYEIFESDGSEHQMWFSKFGCGNFSLLGCQRSDRPSKVDIDFMRSLVEVGSK